MSPSAGLRTAFAREIVPSPMPRWFNVAGPCSADRHYMLPVMRRLPKVRRLIEHESYFILHAPRQVGKTTALLTVAQELNAEGRHVAVLLSSRWG